MFARKPVEEHVNIKAWQEVISPQLKEKLDFLFFTAEDLQRIHQLRELLEESAQPITEKHVKALLQQPHTQKIIPTPQLQERIRHTFAEYIRTLGSVELNEQYVISRIKIGQVHHRIQLAPDWFIASYSHLMNELLPAVQKRFGKRGFALINSLQKLLLLDAQIVLESYEEAHEYRFVDVNSQIIEEVVQLNQFANVVETMGETMQDATNVSAASQQLTAAVNDVATEMIRIAQEVDEIGSNTRNNQEQLHQTLQGFNEMTMLFNATKGDIQELRQEIEGIEGIVQLIKGLADSTNLLALNASIEAARAGEEGKGFAVVAQEVRKLAEQTKASIEQITTVIEQVQGEAKKVSDRTEGLVLHLHQQIDEAKQAVTYFDEVVDQVNKIHTRIDGFTSVVDESSEATRDIAERMYHVVQATENNQGLVGQMGLQLYKMSRNVDELRDLSSANLSKLANPQFLRMVRTDHILIGWWAYNALLGYHSLDGDTSLDAHNCTLQKWISEQRTQQDPIVHHSLFAQLEVLDQELHGRVKEIAQLISLAQHDEAKQVYEKLIQLTQRITEVLDQLREASSQHSTFHKQ
ncbi:globin-coupled sensor protein [Rubeoparvulum massiliense]|uniref:globin-coupled sensor protein n=1 Tax=Rubeoparvulum massiliense TaxID=1631346 RepID=UPI00065E3209|nr:globin-coupled sensor protein [Rubeoparvulum massiliense]